jgi:hypothetical protein
MADKSKIHYPTKGGLNTMPRYILTLIMAISISSCITPYQKMGFRGGYKNTQVQPDLYFIEVQVNGFSGKTRAVEYWHKRASELCPGGYEMIQQNTGENKSVYVANNPNGQINVYNVKKPYVDGYAKCKKENQQE